MLLFIIAFLIFILWYSKIVYRSYFNHLSVFIGVNSGSIILMYGCSIINDSLSPYTWICIWMMFACFLIGSYLGKYRFTLGRKDIGRDQYVKTSNIGKLKELIIIYSIVYDIFAFYYLFRLNAYYGLGRMLADMTGINIAFQTGDFSLGISSCFTPIGIPLSLMILYYQSKVKNRSFIMYIQYALCYIQCISPRRDTFFYDYDDAAIFDVSELSEHENSNTNKEEYKKSANNNRNRCGSCLDDELYPKLDE